MSIEASTPVVADILIVGADPVGLFGAYYAGLRGFRVAVLDSLPELGGQVGWLYPDKLIAVGGGRAGMRCRDVVADLAERASRFAPFYLQGCRADTLVRLPDAHDDAPRFVVTTDRGKRIRCGVVVVTSGAGNFTHRRLPPVQGFVGRYQSYFAPDLSTLTGKDVVINGDGDSAIGWALQVQEAAASVTLVQRGEALLAEGNVIEQARSTGLRIMTMCQVINVHGADRVESVRVEHQLTGDVCELPCQEFVVALGSSPTATFSSAGGLDIEDRRRIAVDDCMATQVRGIFAAGDITQVPGRTRPLAAGFAEIATAVTNATGVLDASGVVESLIEALLVSEGPSSPGRPAPS